MSVVLLVINDIMGTGMVDVAQLVRASVCGTEGCGFKSHLPPHKNLQKYFINHYKVSDLLRISSPIEYVTI